MVLRKGDPDAGQIYIKCNHMDGEFSLYGPALALSQGDHFEQAFEVKVPACASEAQVDRYLEQQAEFDTDLWVIELESKSGEVYLEDA